MIGGFFWFAVSRLEIVVASWKFCTFDIQRFETRVCGRLRGVITFGDADIATMVSSEDLHLQCLAHMPGLPAFQVTPQFIRSVAASASEAPSFLTFRVRRDNTKSILLLQLFPCAPRHRGRPVSCGFVAMLDR